MRPLTQADAEPLARAYVRNRDHLRPWEPERPEDFFTPAGQAARVGDRLREQREGRVLALVLAGAGRIVGTMTLANIVMGPFRSTDLGYWVDAEHNGRGLATKAVELVCELAGEHLGLHRIQASTLVGNLASQRVLGKAGFTPIGMAPTYLHIDGAWRDCLLFQRILNDRRPPL
ncbi:N-acetyltransferase [Sphaerisporangium album]|uniref:N-acetyltransferase n=2 Tax=Sphaerisporangium album TaxID=509200 RepID=A0A367FEF3_9ACTN|nr:N-acetyltransferase [Sphaerisporangium album]